jgi:hypothetical protein
MTTNDSMTSGKVSTICHYHGDLDHLGDSSDHGQPMTSQSSGPTKKHLTDSLKLHTSPQNYNSI